LLGSLKQGDRAADQEPAMTIASLSHRLRLLLRGERGMALPTALFAMVASVGVASAAVVASVDVQQGTKRDSGSKNAIAAADAGASVARMRLIRHQSSLGVTNPCVGPNGEAQAPSGGWCPATTPVSIGDATYTYRFSAAGTECGEYDLCLISTGTADGVSRRVEITFDNSYLAGAPGSDDEEGGDEDGGDDEGSSGDTSEQEDGWTGGVAVSEGLIGEETITFSGNADIQVGVGTNGNLVSSGNASICGDIRVGVGKKWTKSGNAKQCSGYAQTQGNQVLPPVSSFMPSDIATNNSNYRLVKCVSTNNPVGCQSDTYAGGKWNSTTPWNPTTRAISASGNTTLTFGGGNYWICSISLSGNSQIIMADGAHVRFFFDTPENCNNTTQINMTGNNSIAATGYQPDDDQFDIPGFYLLGSPTWASSINLSGNHSTANEFVIYGPNTAINISGNATHKGMIAGKSIAMSGNGKIENDDGFLLQPELNPWHALEEAAKKAKEDAEQGGGDQGGTGGDTGSTGIAFYTPQHYVECTGIPVSSEAPNADC
jgi:hypothetical protein